MEECPVDCIYEGERKLYINPNECIDCGACETRVPGRGDHRGPQGRSRVQGGRQAVLPGNPADPAEPVGNPGGAAKVDVISSTPRWWRRTDGRAVRVRGHLVRPAALRRAGAGTGDTAAAPDPALVGRVPRADSVAGEQLPSVAMDMVGFGASASLPAPQHHRGLRTGGVGAARRLGRRPGHRVLGHHTGAAVALEMAAADGGRLDAVVLSSCPWADAEYRAGHTGAGGVDCAERVPDGDHLRVLWDLRRPYYPDPVTGLLDRFVPTPSRSGWIRPRDTARAVGTGWRNGSAPSRFRSC